MNTVAFITDFGTSDWYAGALKGSVLSVAAALPLVDITHSLPAGSITAAAFTLAASIDAFPEETVFCVVVDPGVRNSRRVLVASVRNRFIVCPDNGIISWTNPVQHNASVFALDPAKLPASDSTLVLRADLLGLTCGCIASGKALEELGARVYDYVTIPFPHTAVINNTVSTAVLSIDHFGNIITAAPSALLEEYPGWTGAHIAAGDPPYRRAAVVKTYEEVPRQSLLVYAGSAGYLEIGLNGGSAAALLKLRSSDTLSLIMQ